MAIKLLVSPISIKEVELVLTEPPDIIDIKNPAEGSLGANFPWVISDARKKIDEYNSKSSGSEIKLSAAIGDFPDLPGSASLAALGAAFSGANYVKIGLMGPTEEETAMQMAKTVVKSVKDHDSAVKVVIAGYGDSRTINASVDPMLIPRITAHAGADVAMLDTAVKNGRSIFEHLTEKQLRSFAKNCTELGLESALAGSLKLSDLEQLKSINPTIIGVRSMVCENFDREKGEIKPESIKKIKAKLRL